MTTTIEEKDYDALMKTILSPVRTIVTPAKDLVLALYETVDLKPGQIMFSPLGTSTFPGGAKTAQRLAARLHGELGIECTRQVPNEYEGAVRASLVANKNEVTCRAVTASWYPRWYSATELCSTALSEILYQLSDEEDKWKDKALYRGESRIYDSVRSTLSRSLNTTERTILENAAAHIEQSSATIRKMEGQGTDKNEVRASLQHRGAPTNFIDFTMSPWIALYFAAANDDEHTGRILSIDSRQRYFQDRIIDARKNTDHVGRLRAEKQCGFLITAIDGILPEKVLREVIRVGPEDKSDVCKFLNEELHLSGKHLFPDMEEWLKAEVQAIPFDVAVRLWMDQTARGGAEETLWQIEQMMMQCGREVRGMTFGCLYCKAVALGKLGRASEALDVLSEIWASEKPKRTAKALKRNRQVWRTSIRKRDRKYAVRRTNTEVFSELWQFELGEYELVDVNPEDPGQATIKTRQTLRISPGPVRIPTRRDATRTRTA